MDTIRKTLKMLTSILDKMIDDGDCDHITVEELQKVNAIIIPPQTMGREDAAKYLGLSLNMFHELRDIGIVPQPKCRKGFKEKEYYLDDLKCAKEKVNKYKNNIH